VATVAKGDHYRDNGFKWKQSLLGIGRTKGKGSQIKKRSIGGGRGDNGLNG